VFFHVVFASFPIFVNLFDVSGAFELRLKEQKARAEEEAAAAAYRQRKKVCLIFVI
jgi:hypothetical protein